MAFYNEYLLVKQDLFLTDVTNCVSSLKKVVEDMRSIGAQEGQLQMANPTARLARRILFCHLY